MYAFVTEEQAAAHLRIDYGSGSPDALWLSIFIPAISQAVALWLKDDWRLYVPEIDSSGEIVIDSSGDPVPTNVYQPVVVAATLLELGSAYRFREGEGVDNVVTPDAGYGYILNKASTALLIGLRKPTVR